MADYARVWDFSTKTGDPILGSEVDDEFDALVTAVASKVDESREAAASGIATLDGSSLIPVGISGNATSGGGQIPEATATALGAVELATAAEAITGTDASRVISADVLQAVFDQNAGVVDDLLALTDPGADRVLFWDDSADTTGQAGWLTLGTGLAITDTTIAVVTSELSHDALAGFVAEEHVDHSGVSVIAANSGLAASNNDLQSNIGLSIDISTLTELSATSAIDLDVDQLIVDDNGTEKRADAAVLVTPELGTTVSTTTDTLNEADNFGKLTRYSNTGATVVTLPNGLKTGYWAVLMLTGSGGSATLQISAAGSLTTAYGFDTCNTQYGVITVFHLGSNVWTAWGLLES